MTDKYEILLDLCEAFDNFSESERKLHLFKYLGLFSRRNAIPDQYFEDPDDPFFQQGTIVPSTPPEEFI